MYIYKCVYVYIYVCMKYIYMHTHAHGKTIKKEVMHLKESKDRYIGEFGRRKWQAEMYN